MFSEIHEYGLGKIIRMSVPIRVFCCICCSGDSNRQTANGGGATLCSTKRCVNFR